MECENIESLECREGKKPIKGVMYSGCRIPQREFGFHSINYIGFSIMKGSLLLTHSQSFTRTITKQKLDSTELSNLPRNNSEILKFRFHRTIMRLNIKKKKRTSDSDFQCTIAKNARTTQKIPPKNLTTKNRELVFVQILNSPCGS
uniref:Uncharacterized protein n=1 Tax=Nelumbo nucifera TaxID=4432 RepID=A0A822ZXH9_NELNU|nr:TPA_asm: hypothetical protein HUJ06_017493 [Nelumbo nucifera]